MGVDREECWPREQTYFERWGPYIPLVKKFYDGVRPVIEKLQEKKDICAKDISQKALAKLQQRAYVDMGHLTPPANDAVAETMLAAMVNCNIFTLNEKSSRDSTN